MNSQISNLRSALLCIGYTSRQVDLIARGVRVSTLSTGIDKPEDGQYLSISEPES